MNPAAIAVITDKENMKFLRDKADQGISTGVAVLKWTGITIGVALGGWLLYKAGSWVAMKISNANELRKDTKNLDPTKATISETEAKSLAERLYQTGFNQDSMWTSWADYSESTIKDVLNQLANEHDWLLLFKKFGNRKVRVTKSEEARGKEKDIIWFLAQDDTGDVAEYQKILNNKGINVKL